MSQDQKREVIIDAALKRFAHFGVAKTTMNEIAADLAISKASLYYYFPDKISLYAAVLKSISQANADEEAELQERENDPRLVDEGSYVRRGQTLAIIKTDQLNIDLESAEDVFRNTVRDLQRYENAFQTGGVTQQQLDQARLYVENAKVKKMYDL